MRAIPWEESNFDKLVVSYLIDAVVETTTRTFWKFYYFGKDDHSSDTYGKADDWKSAISLVMTALRMRERELDIDCGFGKASCYRRMLGTQNERIYMKIDQSPCQTSEVLTVNCQASQVIMVRPRLPT